MSQEAARTSIMGLLVVPFASDWPTVPISYNNDPFDWGQPPEEFCYARVEFFDGAQIGMSWQPRTRLQGFVYFMVYSRQGIGDLRATRLIDWATAQVAYKTPGAVRLEAPNPRPDSSWKGFMVKELAVPFHSDE